MITILHLSVMRRLSAGQRTQLHHESIASEHLEHIRWDTLAYHSGLPVASFERQLPHCFRGLFLRNAYAWFVMWRLRERYDYILCRHITFDPFVLLCGALVPNRVTVHHAKEVYELRLVRPGLAGRLASHLEAISGAIAVKRARAIVAVTDDIRRHQLDTRAADKDSCVYPNGIVTSHIPLLNDCRDQDAINAVFICGTFSPWHGLDLLVEEVATQVTIGLVNVANLHIHLIGDLSEAQRAAIVRVNSHHQIFVIHGTREFHEYVSVLDKCDVGIGSLALYRKALNEAATLKVREYLALGLPVYSGHRDTALPEAFKYYRHGAVSLSALIAFANEMKVESRHAVRDLSAPYIEKARLMQSVAQWLADLK